MQDEKTDAEIIEMMNPYNGGDYIELPLGIYDLSYFLLRDKRYDLYARLLSNLYFFSIARGDDVLDAWCGCGFCYMERNRKIES